MPQTVALAFATVLLKAGATAAFAAAAFTVTAFAVNVGISSAPSMLTRDLP